MDKKHSTNYYDTFIEVAEDTKVACGTIPLSKSDKKTIAEMQYELLINNPYEFSSDDVFFKVYAEKNDIIEEEYDHARQKFFSKGQPCFRASPLTKTCGFGVHSDKDGKIAIYGMESEAYEKFCLDDKVKKVRAMRSSRK